MDEDKFNHKPSGRSGLTSISSPNDSGLPISRNSGTKSLLNIALSRQSIPSLQEFEISPANRVTQPTEPGTGRDRDDKGEEFQQKTLSTERLGILSGDSKNPFESFETKHAEAKKKSFTE
jgi:ABC-type bacteriocin/lantibiotic exporter with double-glycine peptidase domain